MNEIIKIKPIQATRKETSKKGETKRNKEEPGMLKINREEAQEMT